MLHSAIMPDCHPDTELVIAFRQGDKNAFSGFIEKYQKRVYHLARGITANHHIAEEVSQETFIRFWKSLRAGRFDQAQEVYPYLRTICINLCRDYFGAQKRKMEHLNEIELAAEPDCPSRAGEDVPQVMQAIESLSAEQREILTLRVVEGLSYEEISRHINCPVGTVMSRLFRARMELKAKLGTVKI